MNAGQTMTARDWGLIGLLSLIWGSVFYFIVIALRDLPPNTLSAARMLIAAPPMLLTMRMMGERLPMNAASWRIFASLGALNVAIPYILFVWAQTRLPSGLASVLNATTPLWGVLVAHLLTHDEKATPARIAGAAIGFAGVMVMIGHDGLGGGDAAAYAACLVSTLFYALAAVYAKRSGATGMTPVAMATGQVIMAALFLSIAAAATDAPWTLPMPGLPAIASILIMALVSTSLAYILYFRLVESAGASNSLFTTFLMPVVAILLGSLFLGETMAPRHWAGIALIALGLAVIDGRLLARRRNVP